MDSQDFDLWADDYDIAAKLADEKNEYPFAGYKEILNAIYGSVMEKAPVKILDIGIGTGTLAAKLYDAGNGITGVDFSNEMLSRSNAKMPNAKLIEYDFTKGLPSEIADVKYDFIISTYSLHHLADDSKVSFIKQLLAHIDNDGVILIGDIAFRSRVDLLKCMADYSDLWDDGEYYIVYSELREHLADTCALEYRQYSHCSGILEIRHHSGMEALKHPEALDDSYYAGELKNFLDKDGRLKSYPVKQRPKTLALYYLASKFEKDRKYTEKEVNQILNNWHTFEDWAMLRRDLYDKWFLGRDPKGKEYWLENEQPTLASFGMEK